MRARTLLNVRKNSPHQKRNYSNNLDELLNAKIIKSTTNDPYINKSLEHHLFNSVKAGPVLYLWQNDKTVFIGRNQNAWKECHIIAMEEDNVNLVRRFSGGGAVYQDLGNLCWSLFFPSSGKLMPKENLELICDAIPVPAEVSGRNDITVNGRKVSGSAFHVQGNRSLHHGTLLVNVDSAKMERYLNVNKEKLISKGVASVRARVMNLGDENPNYTVEFLNNCLIDAFSKKYGKSDVVETDGSSLQCPELQAMINQMKDWEWRFGHNPAFDYNLEHRFNWGIMDLQLSCKEGVITKVVLHSDSLYPDMIINIESRLQNTRFDKTDIANSLAQSEADFIDDPVIANQIREYSAWLCNAL